jgi:hypothetical protein
MGTPTWAERMCLQTSHDAGGVLKQQLQAAVLVLVNEPTRVYTRWCPLDDLMQPTEAGRLQLLQDAVCVPGSCCCESLPGCSIDMPVREALRVVPRAPTAYACTPDGAGDKRAILDMCAVCCSLTRPLHFAFQPGVSLVRWAVYSFIHSCVLQHVKAMTSFTGGGSMWGLQGARVL